MKALSLRQPWAWLVVHGTKRIENRRWPTGFRGDFLIHAAKGMTLAEYEDALWFARSVDPLVVIPPPNMLERGGIVGRARLVAVVRPCEQEECRHRWHMHEQYGFVLDDVAPLPFVPCRGMLGFFSVPDEILAEEGCL